MDTLTNSQLNTKIRSFMDRKMGQFPDIAAEGYHAKTLDTGSVTTRNRYAPFSHRLNAQY